MNFSLARSAAKAVAMPDNSTAAAAAAIELLLMAATSVNCRVGADCADVYRHVNPDDCVRFLSLDA
jgi:hypothetical protein